MFRCVPVFLRTRFRSFVVLHYCQPPGGPQGPVSSFFKVLWAVYIYSNAPKTLKNMIQAPVGRAGAFSRDFTTILAPESRAFSGALKIEKLKAPLIPGPRGAWIQMTGA